MFSYTTSNAFIVAQATSLNNLYDIFQTPLSAEAYQQYTTLRHDLHEINLTQGKDIWSYIWGSSAFSAQKAYQSLIGSLPTHLALKLSWKTKCQPKQSVLFWLLLQNKLNTKDKLRRRHMHLDSYICENCILQKNETTYHLFLRCNFARACWSMIRLLPPQTDYPLRAVMRLKHQLNMVGAMEIIILMTWSIWQCRNGWIFESIPPTLERCRGIFTQDLRWLLHRLKPATSQNVQSWTNSRWWHNSSLT
jgi:hypothetical protein